ncbi:corrinoid protein, partial [Candidatus Bathyarchaeota archaeon]|nr:corrinoid protein [Candidatus Bathyarchaeota archaeon]
QDLVKSITDYDEEAASAAAENAVEEGVDSIEAIEHGVAVGLKKIGEEYERGETFLPELMMGANAAQKALKVLLEHMPQGSDYRGQGRIVIGTVEGDIHDIGKNIVAAMLRANGFDIVDLGVDVSIQRFVDSVKKFKPDVLGMSALLTNTMPKQQEVIQALKRENVRDSVRVILGGVPVTEEWVKKIGADDLGKDAIDTVQKLKK